MEGIKMSISVLLEIQMMIETFEEVTEIQEEAEVEAVEEEMDKEEVVEEDKLIKDVDLDVTDRHHLRLGDPLLDKDGSRLRDTIRLNDDIRLDVDSHLQDNNHLENVTEVEIQRTFQDETYPVTGFSWNDDVRIQTREKVQEEGVEARFLLIDHKDNQYNEKAGQ